MCCKIGGRFIFWKRKYLSLEQWLIRRIHDWISGRRVGIERPGIDWFIRIEGLRIFPGLIRVNGARRIFHRFVRRTLGQPVRPGSKIFCHE
jgi:hypothetical protein